MPSSSTPKPHHDVYVDENDFICIVHHGNLNEELALEMFEKIKRSVQVVLEAERPVLILADTRGLGTHTDTTRRIGLEIRESIPFKKMAIIVSRDAPRTAKLSQIVTDRSSRKKYIRYFETEEAARKWLRRFF